MDARRASEPIPMKNRTTAERKSDRELVVTRTFNGPARIVCEVGSPMLSDALERLGLVDEYHLVIHPVLPGHGPNLFQGLERSRHLDLVSTTHLTSGLGEPGDMVGREDPGEPSTKPAGAIA